MLDRLGIDLSTNAASAASGDFFFFSFCSRSHLSCASCSASSSGCIGPATVSFRPPSSVTGFDASVARMSLPLNL